MSVMAFILLPDSREGDRGIGLVNQAIRERNMDVSGTEYHAPFSLVQFTSPIPAWKSFGSGLEPDAMLAILRGIDWVHPVKVMYRAEPDNTWSFVTLGLSSPWMGEEDAA